MHRRKTTDMKSKKRQKKSTQLWLLCDQEWPVHSIPYGQWMHPADATTQRHGCLITPMLRVVDPRICAIQQMSFLMLNDAHLEAMLPPIEDEFYDQMLAMTAPKADAGV